MDAHIGPQYDTVTSQMYDEMSLPRTPPPAANYHD